MWVGRRVRSISTVESMYRCGSSAAVSVWPDRCPVGDHRADVAAAQVDGQAGETPTAGGHRRDPIHQRTLRRLRGRDCFTLGGSTRPADRARTGSAGHRRPGRAAGGRHGWRSRLGTHRGAASPVTDALSAATYLLVVRPQPGQAWSRWPAECSLAAVHRCLVWLSSGMRPAGHRGAERLQRGLPSSK